MALAKLHYGDEIRIVELSARTTDELNQKIQDCFGLTCEDVDLFFVNEGQLISIKQCQDLLLGLRLVIDDGPIHIKIAAKGEKPSQPAEVAAPVNIYGLASQAIYEIGKVYCPPDQLEALMEVLKFKNKRLVKAGLLKASAIASSTNEVDEDEDGDEGDQEDDEDVKPEKDTSSLPVAELVDEKPTACENKEEEAAERMETDGAHGVPHGPPLPHGPPHHGLHGHGPPLHVLAGPMRKMFVPGPVAEALQEKGITLPPPVLHTVLRMLKVRPMRFVKLGLVCPIGVARRDYLLWNKRIRKGGGGCAADRRKGCRGKRSGDGKGKKGPGMHGPPHHGPPPVHGLPHHGPGMEMHGPPPPHGGPSPFGPDMLGRPFPHAHNNDGADY